MNSDMNSMLPTRRDDEFDKLADEMSVVSNAGRWSLALTTIEDRFTEPSTGWLGKL